MLETERKRECREHKKLYGWHKEIQFMFQGPPISGNSCALCKFNEFLQHGELVQIQAVEYREKQNKVNESLNKRLKSLISKEQEGEIEPLMF